MAAPGIRPPTRRCFGGLLVVALALVCVPASATGQTDGAGPSGDVAPPSADGRSFWEAVAGTPAGRRRAVVGFWAMHPYEPQFPELDWTGGLGFGWSQWFLATFVNSYDERSFIAGLERYWARGAWGPWRFGVGYRVGLVTGYDERLVSWAEYVPILPFGGVVAWSDLGPVAADVYYVYRAITLEASIRF